MKYSKVSKLAIEALEQRRQKFAPEANMFKRGIETIATARAAKTYDELTEAIEALRGETDLMQRCKKQGWQLLRGAEGWVLLGNGAPAEFRETRSLADWLEKQEPRKRQEAAEQLEMDIAA